MRAAAWGYGRARRGYGRALIRTHRSARLEHVHTSRHPRCTAHPRPVAFGCPRRSLLASSPSSTRRAARPPHIPPPHSRPPTRPGTHLVPHTGSTTLHKHVDLPPGGPVACHGTQPPAHALRRREAPPPPAACYPAGSIHQPASPPAAAPTAGDTRFLHTPTGSGWAQFIKRRRGPTECTRLDADPPLAPS
jgi:hypothetical protein